MVIHQQFINLKKKKKVCNSSIFLLLKVIKKLIDLILKQNIQAKNKITNRKVKIK